MKHSPTIEAPVNQIMAVREPAALVVSRCPESAGELEMFVVSAFLLVRSCSFG